MTSISTDSGIAFVSPLPTRLAGPRLVPPASKESFVDRMAQQSRDELRLLGRLSFAGQYADLRRILLLSLCLIGITFVSAYDAYWSFKTQDVLLVMEKNPIGAWLIQLDGGDIALFMTLKMVGTMLVILAMPALYVYKRSWGMLAVTGVAAFQLWLYLYINYGHLLQ